MKKVYSEPKVYSEKLEFGVFGCYQTAGGKPGNNGIGNAFGQGFYNDPTTYGNHGKTHWWSWKHKNK